MEKEKERERGRGGGRRRRRREREKNFARRLLSLFFVDVRRVIASKQLGKWTQQSLAHLEAFKAKLQKKNPSAEAEFSEFRVFCFLFCLCLFLFSTGERQRARGGVVSVKRERE